MDFNNEENVTLDGIMSAMMATGFQATNVALAIEEINRMVSTCIIYTFFVVFIDMLWLVVYHIQIHNCNFNSRRS